MKATVEIPDEIFRRAKSRAAEQGISLCQFVSEAIEEKLSGSASIDQKPWMKHVGKLKDLREETARVDRFIEEAFETIDPELWK
ncbi:MAG TPA: hypothetical protein VJX70_02485 [Candidatus Acidoferrum sp.]|nr:hypothetical protein [Candidatus Acidoferrum sp.]